MAICLYPKDCTDFSANGLGVLTPLECRVTEEACGMFELELVQPIDDTLRWAQLEIDCLIKADVPTRESPLYEEADGQDAWTKPVTVTRNVWTVSSTTVGEYMRSGPGTNYKNYGYLKNGAKVTEIGRQTVSGRLWLHVIVQKGGRKCWMSSKWLKQTGTVTETLSEGGVKAASPQGVSYEQSREQLFRIYSVERDAQRGAVTARAMHVFYDLRGNLVNKNYEAKKADAKQVIKDIFADLNAQSDFDIHVSEGVSGKITGDYGWKNPVECLLDPDEGILPQAKATLVRDNFDVYILPDFTRDSNVTIRRGKNLKGVTVSWDAADIVTRVIPCGRNKKGNPLFLDGDVKHVDSPHVGEHPHPLAKKIDYDVRVIEKKPDKDEDFDKDTMFLDAESARKKLRALAEAEFSENGIDLPSYGMDVDFIMLSGNGEDDDYAGLQSVFLNDTVTVIDSVIGLTAKLRVTGYTWDALAKQYESVTLGDISDLKQTVYSYNLPTGGVSGSKIASGSLSGTAIRDATIDYAKIAVATIQQLTADSIVALTAKIDEIVAGKITTDELYASFAQFLKLHVNEIVAGSINTDSLKAAFAELQVLIAGTATFDRATIRQLVAQAMTLEYGVGDQMFISNLAVSFAQMVGATIGDLVIKASNGKYYHLDVNEEGNVTATERTVTEGESLAGMTDAGEVILGTHITATNLNTKNLLATYALISQIDAARINVDELFAREAFIQLLRTTKIVGQDSIEIIAESSKKGVEDVDVEFYLSDSPTTTVGGEWVSEIEGDIPEGKYLWHHTKTTMKDGSTRITGEQYTSTYEGVVGPQGAGIDHVEEYFGLSTKSTVQPTSWQTDTPTMDATNRYLWNYEKFIYTAGEPQQTEPRIIGVYGDKGTGLADIINYYLISDRNTGIKRDDPPNWTTKVQTTTVEKPYLWNYEEMVWSDGSKTYTEPAVIGSKGEQGLQGLQGPAGEQGIPGPKGDPGTSGKGVKDVAEEYCLSASNTDPSDGQWVKECPTWKEGYYIWTRSHIYYTDDSDSTTTPLLDQAMNVQIGGRNLLSNTGFDDRMTGWGVVRATCAIAPKDNLTACKFTGDATASSHYISQGTDYDPSMGKQFTGSVWVWYDGDEKPDIHLILQSFDGTASKEFASAYCTTPKTWVRIVATGTLQQSNPKSVTMRIGTYTEAFNGKVIYIYHPQLETGNRATDWTSAQEDMDSVMVDADVEYYLSESTTELKGGEWNTVAPQWVNGKYMWSRTKYVTKGGEVRYSEKTCIAGAKGENGKTTYFHIKYSPVENPTADQMTEETSKYIGTYVDFTEADSNDPKKYKWTQFEGSQGEKGDQGIPGVNGQNGETYYLHLKYANKPNPTADEMNDVSGSYIGIYTDTVKPDSKDPGDYKWSKIKGDDGNGVLDVAEEYYLSSSDTDQVDGQWVKECPTWKEGYYIWTRSHIYYTDTSESTTTPLLDQAMNVHIGGRNLLSNTGFDDGMTGWGVMRGTCAIETKDNLTACKFTGNAVTGEHYIVQGTDYDPSMGKQFTGSAWVWYDGDDNPSIHLILQSSDGSTSKDFAKEYCVTPKTWVRIVATGTLQQSNPKKVTMRIGTYADPFDGKVLYVYHPQLETGNRATDWTSAQEDMNSVMVDADVEYYLSESTTELKGGEWNTVAPQWVNGKYMWSRTKYVTKGGEIRYSEKTCIAGAKGENGTGVKDVAEEYYLSSSDTDQVDGSWVKECPTWKEGYYIWTRSHIYYTDGNDSSTTPLLDQAMNVQIGGRNLLSNTGFDNGMTGWGVVRGTCAIAPKDNLTACKFTGDATASSHYISQGTDYDPSMGKQFTGSVWVWYDGNEKPDIHLILQSSDGSTSKEFASAYCTTPKTWVRIVATGTLQQSNPKSVAMRIGTYTQAFNGKVIYIYHPQLETGNRATDWTSAQEDMNSVMVDADVEYYLSTSTTRLENGTWNTEAPQWVNGKYMWSRTKYVTKGGEVRYSNATCIAGAKGDTGVKGDAGRGIKTAGEEYYLSTSNTETTGGKWVPECPTWKPGYYIWTRIRTTYTDGSTETFPATLSDGSNIQIGGSNLLTNTGFENGTTGWGAARVTGTIVEKDNLTVYKFTGSSDKDGHYIIKDAEYEPSMGTQFTGSAWVWNDGTANVEVYVAVRSLAGGTSQQFASTYQTLAPKTWVQIVAIGTLKQSNPEKVGLTIGTWADPFNGKVLYIYHPKLETGNRPTDWNPGVEDLVTQTYLDTYMQPYAEDKAAEQGIAPGVYIGLKPSGADKYYHANVEAVINARDGSFEVHQNQGKIVASSMGIDRITLGNLVFYKTTSGSVALQYDGTATNPR